MNKRQGMKYNLFSVFYLCIFWSVDVYFQDLKFDYGLFLFLFGASFANDFVLRKAGRKK